MSARGSKRRGRPPKAVVMERPKKFRMDLVKKPKYLLNRESETPNSQASTPSASRASSPAASDSTTATGGRRSTRTGGRGRTKGNKRGSVSRRNYNTQTVDDKYSDYHYGSDFGEDSNSNKSDIDDDTFPEIESGEEELFSDVDNNSTDTEFSLSRASPVTAGPSRRASQRPSPIPLWLQEDTDIPLLELPSSSDDILIPKHLTMKALGIYEVMRHFSNLARLSPFRFEDLCACLVSDEQSPLLAEIHMALLKALLREEDAQQTHYGPLDQRDSVNILFYCIDGFTWPEALKSFVESDREFSARGKALDILQDPEYPFVSVEDKLEVLQFLTDQFLNTNPVREELISEGNLPNEDHCRICHRVGKLLCCDSCPAVFHLECMDPPMDDIPTSDWTCSLCKAHQISGVMDCASAFEKATVFFRQEHLGYDRHGRKYWFLARRIFVESEEGEIWYYSTKTQFDNLMEMLDENNMEAGLCRELNDCKDEIYRQMEVTEKVTNQHKGNKKTYFDVENANIIKLKKEKEEQMERELREKTEGKSDSYDDIEVPLPEVEKEETVTSEVSVTTVTTTTTTVTSTVTVSERTGSSASCNSKDNGAEHSEDDAEKDLDEDGKPKDGKPAPTIVTRSKTGSLTPRTFNMEDLRRRAGATVVGKSEDDMSRMTRLKAHQLASGTYLFKLGMENTFKTYVNQYNLISGALTKSQRNEERDKKRHLSHKFSLTQASEFKWSGQIHGTRALLVSTLRQTIIQFESNIQTAFLHPNWPMVKKQWLSSVTTCINPKDFAKALIIFQMCLKPVVFATVWHESLGHTKLQRWTATEREDRKRLEKKEKKEKEEEEERNRLNYNPVKYTLGLKHQVYKQRGEEYRIHGQWGWLWLSNGRKLRLQNSKTLGLKATPHKMMIQVKEERVTKILSVDHNTYQKLMDRSDLLTVPDIQIPKPPKEEVKEVTPKKPVTATEAPKETVLNDTKEDEEINVTDDPEEKNEKTEIKSIEKKIEDGDKVDENKDVAMTEDEIKKEITQDEVKEEKSDEVKAEKSDEVKDEKIDEVKDEVKMEIDDTKQENTNESKEEDDKSEVSKEIKTENEEEKIASDEGTEKMDTESTDKTIEKSEDKTEKEEEKSVQDKEKETDGLKSENDTDSKKEDKEIEKDELSEKKDDKTEKKEENKQGHPKLLVFKAITSFDEIDVCKALTTPGRLAYPKVAKPSKLDEFLQRRLQLKAVEERQLAIANAKLKNTPGIDNKLDGRSQKERDKINQEVAHHLELYSAAHRLSRDHPCYNSLCKLNSSDPTCYSPLCLQRFRLRKELLVTLCKAKAMGIDINSKIGAQAMIKKAAQDKKEELAKRLTSPAPSTPAAIPSTSTAVISSLSAAVTPSPTVPRIQTSLLGTPLSSMNKTNTVDSVTKITTTVTTTTQIKTTTTTTVSTASAPSTDGVLKTALRSPDGFKTRQHLLKPAEPVVDSHRIYSAETPKGKLYLKKIVRASVQNNSLSTVLSGQANIVGRRKKITIRTPVSSTFTNKIQRSSILVLPQHEVRKLSRKGGYYSVQGFNHGAKPNQSVWQYPCSRPSFRTCWMFRTVHLNTLSAVAMQMRILWHCLRWDDMQTKPPSNDGKNQITTDTEITTTEILKHRNTGQFLEYTQYLRRKIVIPLELPKTVREVTSIRSGLRKRKREEAPQSTEPQVTEDWVSEDQLELWEIKQYNDKLNRTNTPVITRSRTGSLVPLRTETPSGGSIIAKVEAPPLSAGPTRVSTSAEDLKAQMEHNLRLQRAAHNQRKLEAAAAIGSTPNKPNILKVNSQENARVYTKIAVPPNQIKTVVTTAGGTPTIGGKTILGAHKVIVAKAADGSTKMIPAPASILPKGAVLANSGQGTPQQSLIRISTPNTTPTTPNQQKIHIIPGPDGKIQVRGLLPGQQLFQLPGNRYQLVNTPTSAASTQQVTGVTSTAVSTPTVVKTVISAPTTPVTTKIVSAQTPVTTTPVSTATTPQVITKVVQAATPVTSNQVKLLSAPTGTLKPGSVITTQQLAGVGGTRQVLIRQQLTPSGTIQKIVTGSPGAAGTNAIVVSGNQVYTTNTGQIVVAPNNNSVSASPQTVVTSNGQQIVLPPGTRLASINGQQVIIRTANTNSPIMALAGTSAASAVSQGNIVLKTVTTQGGKKTIIASPVSGVASPQIMTAVSPQTPTVSSAAVTTTPVQQQIPALVSTSPAVTTPSPKKVLPATIATSPSAPGASVSAVTPTTAVASPVTTTRAVTQPVTPQSRQAVQGPTAQVVQTPQGPSIILQGFKGNLTEQQIAVLKEQVRQQVIKSQSLPGITPTTPIYFQLPPSTATTSASTTPTTTSTSTVANIVKATTNTLATSTTNVVATPVTATPSPSNTTSPTKPKVVVQQIAVDGTAPQVSPIKQQIGTKPVIAQPITTSTKISLVNGQVGTQSPASSAISQIVSPSQQDKDFVVTPDYIQETIKNALKQENLNPEMEEKLLQLQRYHENKGKNKEPVITPPTITTLNDVSTPSGSRTTPIKKRPATTTLASPTETNKDPTWEPSRKRSTSKSYNDSKESKEESPTNTATVTTTTTTSTTTVLPATPTSPTKSRSARWRESQEEKRQQQIAQNLSSLLYKTTEALRKDVTKKRAFLEKELLSDIQREVAVEIAARTIAERSKQDEVRSNVPAQTTPPAATTTSKRKSSTTSTVSPQTSRAGPSGVNQNTNKPNPSRSSTGSRSKKQKSSHHARSTSPNLKKKDNRLHCVCRTPYDDSKFYVGCDLCNNWFHGDCVGITEVMSKTMSEYVCEECRRARETKELFCLCKQPYDEQQFYICCDQCQDWFHGKCVGILQTEADGIDEYKCPTCEFESDINYSNFKSLTNTNFELLRKLIKQLQGHKSSWPFMEPVDATEAPNYYKVIKEPMDLQTIELRITDQSYKKLADFIGDMMKIFENCRYYNPKESPFSRCADALESFFVQKLKVLRAKMTENPGLSDS